MIQRGRKSAASVTVLPLSEPDPAPPVPTAPIHLGTAGLGLWGRINDAFELAPGQLEFLTLACFSLDRAEALRERIEADGSVIQDDRGPRAHPAIRDETANRALVARLLQRAGVA